MVIEGDTQTTIDFTYTGLTLHNLSAVEKTSGTESASWDITYLYDELGKPYVGIYRDTTDANPGNWPDPVVFAITTTDRGDVVGLVAMNGESFAAYRYDAWGNPIGDGTGSEEGIWWCAQQSSGISATLAEKIAGRQVLRYAGYCYDSESAMYYLSARHYDPATRLFLSKDPSRNDGEQSAYQYCLGNPVLGIDPTGFAVVEGVNGKPATPEESAEMRNRVMQARAQWYVDHQPKSTGQKVADGFKEFVSWTTGVGLLSKLTGEVSPSLSLGYDWVTGLGERVRYYGADSRAVGDMQDSKRVQEVWEAFKKNGWATMNFGYNSWEAMMDTVAEPMSSTSGMILSGLSPMASLLKTFDNQAAMVNGYGAKAGTIRNNGDGTATVTITNTTGLASLTTFLEYLDSSRLPDLPWKDGPGSNIDQTYEWTWVLTYEGGAE